MKYSRTLAMMITMALIITSTAHAATREEKRVSDAADVLDQLARIPEKSIPPSLLSHAYGVAVIPNALRAAFWLGASRGKGIIVVRQDDNSWSNPAFVTITDGIASGKMTLGATASVAAGPVGRNTSASTDIQFKAEVYSYSRSRGLFAGVALEGAGVTMDRKANAAYYGSTNMTPEAIFASSPSIAPDTANTFVQVLTAQTARLPTQPGMQAGAATSPPATEEQGEVRTYGMPDPGETDNDGDGTE